MSAKVSRKSAKTRRAAAKPAGARGRYKPGCWIGELGAAITVTDATGRICEMNAGSIATFAASGGAALIGSDVLDCHSAESREQVARLYKTQKPNHYTIRKAGQRKIIHQLPWTLNGEFAGVIELSIPIPDELPHFDRD
jgi:transcriptional regulator with PAS, ATPase and Fis domain